MRLEPVAFDHPDAAGLREQMVAEVSAMYTAEDDRHDRDGGAAVDPSTVIMTSVGYDGLTPVAHVTVRRIEAGYEVKRMFIAPSHRGRGWAAALLDAAEEAVRKEAGRDLGAARIVLHTGARQTAAIALYGAHGFEQIDLYPPYLDVPDSLCFAKELV